MQHSVIEYTKVVISLLSFHALFLVFFFVLSLTDAEASKTTTYTLYRNFSLAVEKVLSVERRILKRKPTFFHTEQP